MMVARRDCLDGKIRVPPPSTPGLRLLLILCQRRLDNLYDILGCSSLHSSSQSLNGLKCERWTTWRGAPMSTHRIDLTGSFRRFDSITNISHKLWLRGWAAWHIGEHVPTRGIRPCTKFQPEFAAPAMRMVAFSST